MPRSGRRRPWLAFGFRIGRTLARDRPSRYGPGRVFLSMRRSGAGAPELRSLGHANARGGQTPARRFARPSPLTVGRGPVPRRASVVETALAGVWFSRGSGDRGGQAPALRAREGFSSLCAVRDRAIPNYSHWGTRVLAGDRPPRDGLQGRLLSP